MIPLVELYCGMRRGSKSHGSTESVLTKAKDDQLERIDTGLIGVSLNALRRDQKIKMGISFRWKWGRYLYLKISGAYLRIISSEVGIMLYVCPSIPVAC